MTATAYLCGCVGEQVGQSFDRILGVMVCPVHGEGFAPHEHGERFHGKLTLELELDTETQPQAEQWLDVLCETMLHDAPVRAIVSSLEKRGGKLHTDPSPAAPWSDE